jgi:hypothetical protein
VSDGWEIDSCDAICPYCGASYQVECEDYTETPVDEECGECGKTYRRWTEYSIDHHTETIEAALRGEDEP